jgi:hypothetical protein
MTLSRLEFINLIENYANLVIEGLDTHSMECMLFDLLVREYDELSEEQILGEIKELYGEEVLSDLVEESRQCAA